MPTIYKAPRNNPRRENIGERRERQAIYQSRMWRELRMAHLMNHPVCQVCDGVGVTELAVDVHHVRSFMDAEGVERLQLAFDAGNLLALCKRCHNQIHHGELKGCATLAEMISRRKQSMEKHKL